MKNFLKVHVITEDDVNFMKEEGYEKAEDINVKEFDFCWDYAQTALVDLDENEVLIWDDNIHTNVDDNIKYFLRGFSYAEVNYELSEVAMMDEDIKAKYSGKRY